jgi:hypothetical protein
MGLIAAATDTAEGVIESGYAEALGHAAELKATARVVSEHAHAAVQHGANVRQHQRFH